MSKECKRDFKVNQTVYLVDYWGTNNGSQAFEAQAKILQVNEENKNSYCTTGKKRRIQKYSWHQ